MSTRDIRAITREIRKLSRRDELDQERFAELAEELKQAVYALTGTTQHEENRLDAQARAEEMLDEEDR